VQSGLQTLVDLLNIGAHRDEMNVFGIFVHVIAENLLTLFVNGIDVVDHNDFLLPWDIGFGLAKRFHFGSEKLDALFFQIVDEHNVVFGENRGFVHSIIFADDGVNQRRFSGTRVSHNE
jgi:hypothetical protein